MGLIIDGKNSTIELHNSSNVTYDSTETNKVLYFWTSSSYNSTVAKKLQALSLKFFPWKCIIKEYQSDVLIHTTELKNPIIGARSAGGAVSFERLLFIDNECYPQIRILGVDSGNIYDKIEITIVAFWKNKEIDTILSGNSINDIHYVTSDLLVSGDAVVLNKIDGLESKVRFVSGCEQLNLNYNAKPNTIRNKQNLEYIFRNTNTIFPYVSAQDYNNRGVDGAYYLDFEPSFFKNNQWYEIYFQGTISTTGGYKYSASTYGIFYYYHHKENDSELKYSESEALLAHPDTDSYVELWYGTQRVDDSGYLYPCIYPYKDPNTGKEYIRLSCKYTGSYYVLYFIGAEIAECKVGTDFSNYPIYSS